MKNVHLTDTDKNKFLQKMYDKFDLILFYNCIYNKSNK